MTQTDINGWALTWGDDETLRPPALPVRSLEDELIPPASRLRTAQRRADAKAYATAIKLRHL